MGNEKVVGLPPTVPPGPVSPPDFIEEDYLSLTQMLDADDVVYCTMVIPEWKGKIRLGSLTADDMIDWLEENKNADKTAGLRLIMKSLVDKNGKRIGSPELTAKFATRNTKVINDITNRIIELNGLNKKTQEEAKNA